MHLDVESPTHPCAELTVTHLTKGPRRPFPVNLTTQGSLDAVRLQGSDFAPLFWRLSQFASVMRWPA